MRTILTPSTFLSGNPGSSKHNGDDTSDSRRHERNCASASFSSIVLAVLSVVLFGALPSYGFSAIAPTAANTANAVQEQFLSEEECVRVQLGYLPSNYVGVSAWKKKSEGSSHRSGVQIAISNANLTTGEDQSTVIPVAIQTYPLNGGAKRRQNKAKLPDNPNQAETKKKKSIVQSPFPTLYWLTCPDISKAVANLERRGFVQIFEDELNADPELSQRLFSCHEEYAQLRWKSLTEEDRNILKCSSNGSESSLTPSLQRMRNMMECSGISGTNFTDISSWDSGYCDRAAAAAIATNGKSSDNDDEKNIIGSSDHPIVPKVPPIKCLHAHYAHYRSTLSLDSTRHINPVGELIHKQLQLDFPDLDL